jgi:hypothetical protein
MRSDFDDWQKWALNATIDETVVGYLSAFKDDLHNFDAASASRGFATPRSWEFVSREIRNVGPEGLNDQILLALITGAVGDGVAVKFHAYRKSASELPSANDILNGVKKDLPTQDVSLHYALTTSLCYALRESSEQLKRDGSPADKRKIWLQQADNFIGFMMRNFAPEVIIMGAKTALRTFKLNLTPKEMPNFSKFVEQYKKIIIQ